MDKLNEVMPVVVWILWSLLATYVVIGAIWSHFHKDASEG